MDHTLTLHIPFVFLGRKELHDDYGSEEEHQMRSIQYIHDALHEFCHVDVRLQTSHEQVTQGAVWILRPSSGNDHGDEVEGQLSFEEKAKLGANVYSCPILLQRTSIPLSTDSPAWRDFTIEATKIFEALDKFKDWVAPIPGIKGARKGKENDPLRWWSLTTSSQCRLNISLVSGLAHETTLDPDLVKRVLITFTALERELTLLSTPSALMEFWPLSRFLEYRAIRELGKEKAALWKRLGEKDWSDKRKDTVYAREKKKWWSGFGEEDRACERVKGRRREWWDVVDEMEVEELVRWMKGFRGSGKRVAIEVELEEDEDDNAKVEGEGLAHPTRTTVAIPSTNTPCITAVTLPSYPSTTSISHLLAYTELIATLLALSISHPHTKLLTFLENHRATTSTFPDDPLRGFEELLTALHISESSESFWTQHLQQSLFPISHSFNQPSPDLLTDPFFPLQTHIDHTLASQRAYIPKFISRYNTAGGFYPTPTMKVYALMLADEHAGRKTKGTRGNEGWLESVREEVRVGEAREKEEDLGRRGRRSPVVNEGRNEWVLQALRR